MRLTLSLAVAMACLLPAATARAEYDCCAADECGGCGTCDSCCGGGGGGGGLMSGWYGGGGPLFLHRNRGNKVVTGRMDNPGGASDFVNDTAVVSTANLDFNYETGFIVTIGKQLDCCNAIEMTYFQVTGFNDWTRADDGDPMRDPTAPFPGVNATSTFRGAAVQSLFVDSEIRSVEINSRSYVTDNASVLFGVRYLDINEAFNMFSLRNTGVANNRGVGLYSINTDNDLIGLQGGGEVNRPVGNLFGVGAWAKGGVYLNFVDQDSSLVQVTDGGGNNASVGGGADDVNWATVIDLGVYGTMYVTDRFSIRGGYMVLFVNGIATTYSQFDWQPAPTWANQVNSNDSLVYDGAFIMAEWNR